MARSSRGRSTTGKAAVPYYRGTNIVEAVKHLRLTATRYLAGRASLNELEEAMNMVREEARVKETTDDGADEGIACLTGRVPR